MSSSVLITAFDAFPGVADNPTAAVLASLPDSPFPSLHRARRLLLPTLYETAPARLLAALDPMPRAIIMLGYSHRAASVTLERQSSGDTLPGRPDAAGRCPQVCGDSGDVRRTRADLDAIQTALAHTGQTSQISEDAGDYVCNHLYHAALSGPCADGGPIGLFMHLPAIAGSALAESSAGSMTIGDMQRALAAIVDCH